MEATAAKKTIKKDYRKIILEGFKNHVLEHGTMPTSIFKFAKELKMKEGDFYVYFTSFEAIKSTILVDIFEETLRQIQTQGVFEEYTAREKFLSFLFTWIEVLKMNRSYLLSLYGNKAKALVSLPRESAEFKEKFKEFVNEIILQGKETEEIASRPVISDRYDEALWLQVGFVFRFWLEDRSAGFEKTDAAIEKSVNLGFDLMGKSALDSFLDFAKFLYQSK
ncbi:TetR family transcriptional regulator C-terminal domain-containing protein [Algoriphagus halophytocola]|uniref:TetR family transcriptional regulator C-terminal domain-containing protein n=1 Tax=Algoriphagus halophytocola TaxID=2991499 RepID=A0ABY6MJS9_9BACT|nr:MULTISPECIES: TetR family transcriptional regulator C-terminal domain-containing protein [unclassified Algoriphagus]UZD24038.1 TetR family transcriptional regulator C-terminal domain-containing protein [Algoriphagus sp. TR-M5]WBL41410.1 TetR family transcriptional regulator C-terminal domain-containing protein [Algoriphagus sp. TR-M9]